MSEQISPIPSLINGLSLRCPRCGEGRLFRSYLKLNESCPACGEELGSIRADDGPAWLTILIVGHIVVLGLLHLPQTGYETMYRDIFIVVAVTLAMALLMLPYAKGLFVGILWWLREKETSTPPEA